MRLTWLGHATVVLDVAGTQVLTDPLLRPNNGPLRRRGPQPRREQWKDSDVVLISHLHYDHVELPSLRMLPDLPLVTTPGNAHYLRRRRLRGVGLRHDEWYDVGHVSVRLTRADHSSRPMPTRPNEACGHLLRAGDQRVWIAGDTSLYPELAEIPDLAGGPIDLAVVPIHGWGPRLSGGHMNSERAAEACAMIGAAAAMPYHWGSLYAPGMQQRPPGWMDRPGPAFAQALAREAPGCTPLVLAPGEMVEVGT